MDRARGAHGAGGAERSEPELGISWGELGLAGVGCLAAADGRAVVGWEKPSEASRPGLRLAFWLRVFLVQPFVAVDGQWSRAADSGIVSGAFPCALGMRGESMDESLGKSAGTFGSFC